VTIEGHRPDILLELEVEGIAEEVALANEQHALDVVLKLSFVQDQREYGDGCGHLEEAVAQEL